MECIQVVLAFKFTNLVEFKSIYILPTLELNYSFSYVSRLFKSGSIIMRGA